MAQSWGWKETSNRIAPQDSDKHRLAKRVKEMKGYTPVLVKGVPMEIREEISISGDLYYVIVLERKMPPTKK